MGSHTPDLREETILDKINRLLPEDIILDILKRVPVKFLLKFEDLIKNPSFIADHCQQSSQNPYLLFYCKNSGSPLCRPLLDCSLAQKPHWVFDFRSASIIGSCNGLLCVQIGQNNGAPRLSLWNPAIGRSRSVPELTIPFSALQECVTGFGFSTIVNDYKIVRTYSNIYAAVDQAVVFSLRGGSWKLINIGNLEGVRLNSETVTTNGAIFWSGVNRGADEDHENGAEVIASFDIVNEVFTLIPGPHLNHTSGVKKLTIYENKLAILCRVPCRGDERFDLIELWVMKEGTCASGERWNWTKIYTNPFSKTLDPVTIWRNQIVYKGSSAVPSEEGRNVHFMDLTTNEVKSFFVPCDGSIQNIYNYAESLVPVGRNQIEES